MPCLRSIVAVALAVTFDLGNFLKAMVRSRTSLAAENLFLRKQLAFYKEHKMQPQRLTDALHSRRLVSDVRPEECSGGRQAGHFAALARIRAAQRARWAKWLKAQKSA